MNNPTKEANYITIFKDGSIIYGNPWLMFEDGHGKWYWNEECRGGVVAWYETEEELDKWIKKVFEMEE
jgi:hypothetical protein